MNSTCVQARTINNGSGDPVTAARDLEPIYDAFESAWQSDKRPALVEYLAQVPKPFQPRAFVHLLALDLSYRRDLGERPGVKGYRAAFPEYENVIQEVFENGYVDSADVRNEFFDTRIGDYEILRRLGAGGQAEVFLARHKKTQEEVVLKVARHLHLDSTREHALINEGRILSQLEHPMVARVQEIGFHEGRPFLVMDYEHGRSLNKGVDDARLVYSKAVRIVLQVAEAVAEAHEKGIVHLDIKPGNVLLREDGSACLIDFGLAQMAHAADPDTEGRCSVVGTPAFMSPEQAAGDWSKIGPQSDVFGLGALLYWFLTGLAPFHGSTFTRCMGCARRGEVEQQWLDRLDIPRQLKAIALQAMDRDPAKRFASVEECAAALRRYRDRRIPSIGRKLKVAFSSALVVVLFFGLCASVSMAFHLNLGLREDGSIFAWGLDYFGRVSNAPRGKGFRQVSAGRHHGLALRSDGSIVAWGKDTSGQVRDTPRGKNFVQVSAWGDYNLALHADGRIFAWGSDSYGQVSKVPKGTGYTSVAAGRYGCRAWDGKGRIVKWGKRDNSDVPASDTYTDTDSRSNRVSSERSVSSGRGSSGSTPEPNVFLLGLVGMALLALRRRAFG